MTEHEGVPAKFCNLSDFYTMIISQKLFWFEQKLH